MRKQTWRMKIELEFPVENEDIEEQYVGDVETDFSDRALERIRSHLEAILTGSPFEHYHILQMPVRNKGR